MGHPSQQYLRYLLAEAWGDETKVLTLESVNEILRHYSLLRIGEQDFERLRGEFSPPEDFKFSNHRSPATVAFMKDEKIFSLWSTAPEMCRVLKELLGHKLVSETVQILLQGDVPSDVIASLVSKRYRLNPSLTYGMVDMYRHYFWDRAAWSHKEWEFAMSDDWMGDRFLAPLYGGDQQALYRAGFNPKYDPKQALRDSHRQVTFRIQYLQSRGDSKNITDLLTKLMREERALYDRLYGEGGEMASQQQTVKHFALEHRDPGVRRLDDFVEKGGGTYSGDGNDERDEQAQAELADPVEEETEPTEEQE